MIASGLRVNTNTSASGAYRNFSASQAGLERNIERLSSGLKINRAADDTAGLAISTRMDNQVRGMKQANRNAQQANNMIQTAEGGLNEVGNILARMRELAVQAASDNITDDDRGSINLEYGQLKQEVTRIAESTEYNGTKLINGDRKSTATGTAASAGNTTISNVEKASAGDYTIADNGSAITITGPDGDASQTIDYDNTATTDQPLDFSSFNIEITLQGTYLANKSLDNTTLTVAAGQTYQVGADNATDNRITLGMGDVSASGLSLGSSELSTVTTSQDAIDSLDAAIDKVNDERSNLGAKQNRIEFSMSNLANVAQNTAASQSSIRDADFATEAANMARNQILVQSGTAMLAQANQISQNVMGLLR